MAKQHKNQLDDAVKITAKGDVKITIPGLVVSNFSEGVWNALDYIKVCCAEVHLNAGTSVSFAIQAFLASLWKKYFEHRNLPDEDYSIKISRTEAYLLIIVMDNSWGFSTPLLKALNSKLQQKLS